jgi:hypothetical protein
VDVTIVATPLVLRLVNTSACGAAKWHVGVDGREAAITRPLDWGGGTAHGYEAGEDVRLTGISTGDHSIDFQAEGIHVGCDAGRITAWEAEVAFLSSVTVRGTSANAPAFAGTAG